LETIDSASAIFAYMNISLTFKTPQILRNKVIVTVNMWSINKCSYTIHLLSWLSVSYVTTYRLRSTKRWAAWFTSIKQQRITGVLPPVESSAPEENQIKFSFFLRVIT